MDATEQEKALKKVSIEIEKLALEVENLRKPGKAFFRNPAHWLGAATAFTSRAGALFAISAYDNRVTMAEIKEARALQAAEKAESKAREATELRKHALTDYEEKVRLVASLEKKFADIQKQIQLAALSLPVDGRSPASTGAKAALEQAAADAGAAQLQLTAPDRSRIPLAYLQISDDLSRPRADLVARHLRANGFAVPRVELVGAKMDNLKSSQVRYYYQPQDTEKAQEIAAMLARDVGIRDVEIKVFPEYQGKVRQNQFEVWLK